MHHSSTTSFALWAALAANSVLGQQTSLTGTGPAAVPSPSLQISSLASSVATAAVPTTATGGSSSSNSTTTQLPTSSAAAASSGSGGGASESGPLPVTTTITLASVGTSLSSLAIASSSTTSSGGPATSVPSPTAALNSTVPQLPAPAVQLWCNDGDNATYCPSVLLQSVELSGIFGDSKTFVDKPTVASLNQTLAEFYALNGNSGSPLTVGQIEGFVNKSFKGEGLELETVAIQNFTSTPKILSNVTDLIYRGFVEQVNSYWSLLIRQTNESALCKGPQDCDSSLIPLNNTIVVPGGRYREVYYWDSFWILEGLLASELDNYAWNLLQNFMDLIELYGFLPNGGRKYYLNRSQPPVFVQMVDAYVKKTGNVTILERALPVMETELAWWRQNRSLSVTSPFTQKNYTVYHYAANVSAPRPEGYVEDIETAFGTADAPTNFTQSERESLYAELASGAETGWDYSSRWCREPVINVSDNNPALRTLNTRAIIPVDLNALLAGDHALLANLYSVYANSSMSSSSSSNSSSNATMSGASTNSSSSSSNTTAMISAHQMIASELSEAVLDLHWDADKLWFYDFNTTANDRSPVYTPAGTFPLWQNITPSVLTTNETAAQAVFAGQRFVAGTYAGIPSVASLLYTGLNWDFPNSWPPHVYTSIKALETLGRSFPNATSFNGSATLSDFSQIPAGQLGLNQSDLQPQPSSAIGNNSMSFSANVAAIQQGKPWWQELAIEYANRYLQASFCSWYSTGGSIPGVLQSLNASQPGVAPNSTSVATIGNIFEKFNLTDVDAAGGGGEYAVVVGFGWTNGVILHTAGEYGAYLAVPSCPLLDIVEAGSGASYNGSQMGNNSTQQTNTTQAAIAMYSGYRVQR